jgi:hypothetical protein
MLAQVFMALGFNLCKMVLECNKYEPKGYRFQVREVRIFKVAQKIKYLVFFIFKNIDGLVTN